MAPRVQLTLKKALETGQLEAFIDQEERRRIGPVSPATFNLALDNVIKRSRSEDEISRSASDDGSPER